MIKGLEALHHPRIKLAKVDISAEGKHDIAYMFFDDTKQYAVIEKELKALVIVKNKGVFVHLLQQSQNVKGYNSLMIIAFKKMAEKDYKGVVEKFCLTEEEYDLLKEVLL